MPGRQKKQIPKQECKVCFCMKKNLKKLPCSCTVCSNCIVHWSRSYIEDRPMIKEISIPCPLDTCKKPFGVNNLQKVLNLQQFTTISDLLTKNYCRRNKEIRFCPNKGCDYAGIISTKSCKTPLQCTKCNFKWRDPTSYSLTEKIYKRISSQSVAKNEYLSTLRKVTFGEACPSCQTIIFKNGGCPHMVCGKCKHEFCWTCLGSYKSYQHSPGNNMCGRRPLFKFILYIFLILTLLSLLFSQITFPSFPHLGWSILKWIGFSAFSVLSIAGQLFPLVILDNFRRYKRYHQANYKHDFYISLIIYLIVNSILLTYIYTESILWNMLKAAITGVLLVASVFTFFIFLDSLHRIMNGGNDQWRKRDAKVAISICLGSASALVVFVYFFGF